MKFLLSAILVIVLTVLSNAQPSNFIKTYGDVENDEGHCVIRTLDGGFLLAGKRIIFGTTVWDPAIYKTDAQGNVEWKKYFIASENDYIHDVMQNSDSTYIMAGNSFSGTGANQKALLMKVSPNGTLLWSKFYNNNLNDGFFKIVAASNGGYVMAGFTSQAAGSFNGFNITHTDTAGTVLWTRSIGYQGLYSFFVSGLAQTFDGGYTVFGQGNPGFGSMTFLVHVDNAGNVLWVKTYATSAQGYEARSFVYTQTGEYLMGIGHALIKTDSAGTVQWSKDYLHSYQTSRLFQLNDGSFLYAGSILTSAMQYQLYYYNTDTSGNVLWSKKTGDNFLDIVMGGTLTPDNHVALTGRWNVPTAQDEMFILKDSLDATLRCLSDTINIPSSPMVFTESVYTMITITGGNSLAFSFTSGNPGIESTVCAPNGLSEMEPGINEINLYPNPFSNSLNISNSSGELSVVILYDITSRKLLQKSFLNSTSLNTQQLAKGIYLYEIRNKNGVIKKGKVVKD